MINFVYFLAGLSILVSFAMITLSFLLFMPFASGVTEGVEWNSSVFYLVLKSLTLVFSERGSYYHCTRRCVDYFVKPDLFL
jgi:uncharacterized membrane protein YkgB